MRHNYSTSREPSMQEQKNDLGIDMEGDFSVSKNRDFSVSKNRDLSASRNYTYDSSNLLGHDLLKDRTNYLKDRRFTSLDETRVPITLEWDNLNYTVEMKDPKGRKCCGGRISKQILYDMSGQAKPGELVAIIGPSGAGKTTLLNALAGRIVYNKRSLLTGSITLNGIPKNSLGSKYTRIAAYVQQDDILFSHLTVKETLLTAALFRLPKTMSHEAKVKKVDALINDLGLIDARDTHIGNDRHKGVSGGERKRTNIGIELINDPSLLFLDEPTSGLDAYQALNVMESLKLLANSGCTIVTSIHQPRSSIFALFDKLIVLSQGHTVYQGPAAKFAVEYFNNLGYKCPSFFNPCDYFLDIVSINNKSKKEEENSRKRINYLIESYSYKKDIESSKYKSNSDFDDVIGISSVKSSIITQFGILSTRNFQQIFRDRFTILIRLITNTFFGCFLAMIYSDMNKGQKSLQDRSGILFFITINQSFQSVVSLMSAFVVEKGIVMREMQAKSYHLIAYYGSKVVTQSPMELIFPMILCIIVYASTDLHPSWIAFAQFLVIITCVVFTANSLGYVIASSAPNLRVAQALSPPALIISLLFAGFYINDESLPVWIGWVKNLSLVRWGFISFMSNEFKGVKNFDCDESTNEDDQCFETGNEYLKRYSFKRYDVWTPLRNLLCLCIGFHLLAFYMLVRNKPKYLKLKSNGNNKNSKMNGSKENLYSKLNVKETSHNYKTMS